MSADRERLIREVVANADMNAISELVRASRRDGSLPEILGVLASCLEVQTLKLELLQTLVMDLTREAMRKTEAENEEEGGLYIVRQYDGMEGRWLDVTKEIPHEEAERAWQRFTANGSRNTKYEDIDYYRVFPANTRMIRR